MYYFNYIGFIILPLASALPWDGAKPTPSIDFENYGVAIIDGWSPAPTPEPQVLFAGFELWKRQSSAAVSLFSSYSFDTCGFLAGSTSHPFTCNSKYTCALDSNRNAVGCCQTPSACTVFTSCVNQAALASCAGDSSCAGNAFLDKCDSTNPFCNQIVLSGAGNAPATNWYCDSTPGPVETIFATATDGGKSVATYASMSLAIPTPSTSSTSTSSTSSTSSTPVPSTTTIAPPTSSSATPPPTNTGSSSHTGAIVGGTIGGVAVLAAVAFGIFYFFFRKKPANDGTTNPAANNAGPGAAYYNQPPPQEKETYVPPPQGPASPYSPTGNTGNAEIYSPPHSPTPQYSPNPNYTTTATGFPQVAEVDGTGLQPRPAPGTY